MLRLFIGSRNTLWGRLLGPKTRVGVAYWSLWRRVLLAPGDRGWARSLVVKCAARNWVVGGSILSAAWAALVAIVG